jgi:small ligand-binding sensory domain FIST
LNIGHATHDDWRMATELALAQLGAAPAAQRVDDRPSPALSGLVYVSRPLAADFDRIIALLATRRPDVAWSGACVPGVVAGLGEYLDEPAVALLVGDVALETGPLSGPAGLEARGASALLVLADPGCPDLEPALRAAERQLGPGAVFGGVVADVAQRAGTPHPRRDSACGITIARPTLASSRVTVGVRPLARARLITSIRNRHIETLDHRPALDVLLEDLQVRLKPGSRKDAEQLVEAIRRAMPPEGLLLGLSASTETPHRRPGFADQRLAHLLGIEPHAGRVAASATALPGERLQLLGLDAGAARADLIRVCTELREELEAEGRSPRFVHYVSCVARGRNLFGSAGAEAALIAHNLGELPLIGFFANGEIGQAQLRGYSAVVTVVG